MNDIEKTIYDTLSPEDKVKFDEAANLNSEIEILTAKSVELTGARDTMTKAEYHEQQQAVKGLIAEKKKQRNALRHSIPAIARLHQGIGG